MKLHTHLSESQVRIALMRAQVEGYITPDVRFAVLSLAGSRSRDHAFDFQLGTENKHSLPPGTKDQYGKKMNVRRYSGGAVRTYAATWHEWGWFMSEIFKADPDARFGDKGWGYSGRQDFDEKTKHLFVEDS